MKTIKRVIENFDYINISYGDEIKNLLFFDIETTGFQVQYTVLYLIGLIYYEDQTFVLETIFAENKKDEEKLLKYFKEVLESRSTLICYNGIGFDLPYLKKKYEAYEMDFTLDNKKILDYYLEFRPFKKLFQLPNLKQITVENFCGIMRENDKSGGELISYYNAYLKKIISAPEEAELLYFSLIKHNQYDLLGLFSLTKLFAFTESFTSLIKNSNLSSLAQIKLEEDRISIIFPLTEAIDFLVSNETFSVKGVKSSKKICLAFIPVQEELKYFYQDYKNYYYLPNEDMAIHKELAKYMDKNHRKKASPENAYTKKTGTFICFPLLIKKYYTKFFKRDFTDPRIYILLEDFLKEEILNLILPKLLEEMKT